METAYEDVRPEPVCDAQNPFVGTTAEQYFFALFFDQ